MAGICKIAPPKKITLEYMGNDRDVLTSSLVASGSKVIR